MKNDNLPTLEELSPTKSQQRPHMILFCEDNDKNGFSFLLTLVYLKTGVLCFIECVADARTLYTIPDTLTMLRDEMEARILAKVFNEESPR